MYHALFLRCVLPCRGLKTTILPGQKKVIIDTPKSKKSIRDIPLVDDLVLLARNLYQGIPPNAFLLTGEQGRFMEPRLLEDRYAKILEHLKIKGKNLYSIRHTFATTFYQKTHDVKSLSEILGHSDVKTTLNRYVHPCEDIKRQGINALLSWSPKNRKVNTLRTGLALAFLVSLEKAVLCNVRRKFRQADDRKD